MAWYTKSCGCGCRRQLLSHCLLLTQPLAILLLSHPFQVSTSPFYFSLGQTRNLISKLFCLWDLTCIEDCLFLSDFAVIKAIGTFSVYINSVFDGRFCLLSESPSPVLSSMPISFEFFLWSPLVITTIYKIEQYSDIGWIMKCTVHIVLASWWYIFCFALMDIEPIHFQWLMYPNFFVLTWFCIYWCW